MVFSHDTWMVQKGGLIAQCWDGAGRRVRHVASMEMEAFLQNRDFLPPKMHRKIDTSTHHNGDGSLRGPKHGAEDSVSVFCCTHFGLTS